jgi:hypothetical protein
VCPICFGQSGALTEGARVGAAVLAVVTVMLVALIGRFAWRLARYESAAEQRDGALVTPRGNR